jgi:hypothetical protein
MIFIDNLGFPITKIILTGDTVRLYLFGNRGREQDCLLTSVKDD